MLGPHLGIVVPDKHDISYYRNLFEYYNEKLDSHMSLYNVDTPDFIVIYLKEILVDDNIKIGRLSQIEIPQKLINVCETNTNTNTNSNSNYNSNSNTKFNSNILPLTLDDKILVLYCKIGSK